MSLSAAAYLAFNAFLKGLNFVPGSGIGYALIMPFLSVLTTTIAVFGLLEVGETILGN